MSPSSRCASSLRGRSPSGGQTSFQTLGMERARLGYHLTGIRHLVPHIPQEHAPHSSVAQVVDDTLLEGLLLPVLHCLQPRVGIADGFITQLKQVRVEVGQVIVTLARTGHVPAGGAAHGVGVVLVLDCLLYTSPSPRD